MSDNQDKSEKGTLEFKVKRMRTRVAASVKTGATTYARCPQKSDPTDGIWCIGGSAGACNSKLTCTSHYC